MRKQRAFYFLLTGLLFNVSVVGHELPGFTSLIESASPAVVQIDTVETSTADNLDQRPRRDIPDIFGDHFKEPEDGVAETLATGSGFIISGNGYILTNAHVVENADAIAARLSDRREYEARVVGVDQRSDLALLKIEEQGLPYLTFANVEQLRVGEWVLAIGSPFGLDYSASVGIVSAIGRSLPTDKGDSYVPFIQSDVALNPGNSGGPLLDLDGKVVGVNSLIFSRSGGSIGLSFAVPANVAQRVVAQLKSKGYVDRGWFGVFIQDVDKNLAKSFGLDKAVGALIAQVEPESPAENAGLQPGDIIVELDGQKIIEADDLPHVVGLIAPGKKVTAEVIHQGQHQRVDIVIGVLPKAELPVTSLIKPDRLGLIVSEIENDETGSWRTGVLVEQVVSGSSADKAGLIKGDIIMQLGYNSIDNPSEYYAAIERLPLGEPVAVRLVRQGRSMFKSLLFQ
jgi:serine protease Do